MLSPEARDAYCQLTPSERLALTLQSMSESLPHLHVGPPEVIDLRLELIRRENAACQRAALARQTNAETQFSHAEASGDSPAR